MTTHSKVDVIKCKAAETEDLVEGREIKYGMDLAVNETRLRCTGIQ